MIRQTPRAAFSLATVIVLSACSAAAPAADDTASVQTSSAAELPPPGYGTLRQDDFTVPLSSGAVHIKVTPLDESVIVLAAPDTYQRLHGMVASRAERIRQMAERAGTRGDPKVFLVSFFTYGQQAQFDPTALQLLSQGILYFQQGILPLTPEWGREQLKQQETQSALYLFDPAIDLNVVFELEYSGARSFAWAQIIRTLQAERGRVMSRVKG
jgi:hypothetical protein